MTTEPDTGLAASPQSPLQLSITLDTCSRRPELQEAAERTAGLLLGEEPAPESVPPGYRQRTDFTDSR